MEKHDSILVITDDSALSAPLVAGLRGEDFFVDLLDLEVVEARYLAESAPQMVLVDFGQVSWKRLDVCQTVRERYSGPLLVMADCVDEMHQVLGLEMGADDFIVKPVSFALLIARIRALLRRRNQPADIPAMTLRLGAIEVDGGRREVRVGGQLVDLTSREFDLLWYLASNAREVVSRDKIYEDLLGVEYNGYDRSVDIYISRIRQKLGDSPRKPHLLKTVRGVGYLLGG